MGISAVYDRTLFYNSSSRYAVVRLKTADIMIPQEARAPYKFKDHLIRFNAVGYDLPQSDKVTLDLEGTWEDGKYGLQFHVERWNEIIPPKREPTSTTGWRRKWVFLWKTAILVILTSISSGRLTSSSKKRAGQMQPELWISVYGNS